MKVIVTGGRSEIGQAIIRGRLDKGDRVLTTVSDMKNAPSLKEELPGVQIIPFQFLKYKESKADFENWISDTGLDGLVLNAWGKVTKKRGFLQHKLDFLTDDLKLNIEANIWLIHFLLPHLLNSKCPRIVFISSLSSEYGMPLYSSYAMGKAAIEALIRVIANEYGKEGLIANSILTGFTDTARVKKLSESEENVGMMNRMNPSGRVGIPKDVSELCNYMLSDSCFINGESIRLSGGFPKLDWREVFRK